MGKQTKKIRKRREGGSVQLQPSPDASQSEASPDASQSEASPDIQRKVDSTQNTPESQDLNTEIIKKLLRIDYYLRNDCKCLLKYIPNNFYVEDSISQDFIKFLRRLYSVKLGHEYYLRNNVIKHLLCLVFNIKKDDCKRYLGLQSTVKNPLPGKDPLSFVPNTISAAFNNIFKGFRGIFVRDEYCISELDGHIKDIKTCFYNNKYKKNINSLNLQLHNFEGDYKKKMDEDELLVNTIVDTNYSELNKKISPFFRGGSLSRKKRTRNSKRKK